VKATLQEVDMTKLTAIENITLDGVMQAPGSPDEDTRGGFAHGGWARPYSDEVSMRVAAAGMAAGAGGAMLFGRVTYERFRHDWAGRDDNPFSPVLDARRKYVASTTLTEPLPWRHSTLLCGDAVAAVRELKASGSEDHLALLGSGVLLRALLAADLVDELRLSIHPLVLGRGTRLFPAERQRLPLVLAESVITTTGVVIATYRLAAELAAEAFAGVTAIAAHADPAGGCADLRR
jgi:dihydrofolate reductase